MDYEKSIHHSQKSTLIQEKSKKTYKYMKIIVDVKRELCYYLKRATEK